MKQFMIAAAGCVALSFTCLAGSFELKSDKDGKLYGPYEFKDGEKVVIGNATFTLVQSESGASALKKRMEDIILPSLEFREANITDVLGFLRNVSAENDPADGAKGVNFILKANPADVPTITLSLRSISVADAVKYITEVAGLTFEVEDNTVVIEVRK